MEPTTPGIDVAQRVAAELVARGARAVALVGSYASNTATSPYSDIDLYAIGAGPEYLLEVHDSTLVSISWRNVAGIQRSFIDPATALLAVPAWRSAIMLHDPSGVTEGIQSLARAWKWESISAAADSWVADSLTGYAEEVLRLGGAITRSRESAAAVQRNVLALRLPKVVAVHLRLLPASESTLSDEVSEAMGAEWSAAQATAFALGGESIGDSSRAAIHLFRLACVRVGGLLDERQAAVTTLALATVV